MKKSLALIGSGLLVLSLTACRGSATPDAPVTQVTPPTGILGIFEGILQSAGISVYTEGTHRLENPAFDGTVLLLSESVDLDPFIGMHVRVTGVARPTVEQGGTVVRVADIEVVEFSSSSASSEEAPVFEPAAEDSSSVEASSVQSSEPPVAASSSPPPPPPPPPKPAVSSRAASVKTVSSIPPPPPPPASSAPSVDAKTAAMAKARVDASTFTQLFCSKFIGFCVPLHKSWYYNNSFGAVSPYLWHVELSSQAVENPGDGTIVINLVSGPIEDAAEEDVVQKGDFVIGYRSWTGNRHFQISAPAALRSAVQYMTDNLSVYQGETAGSNSSI